MRKPSASVAKGAVCAGLALGLILGTGAAVVTPTSAYATLVSSDQAATITVPNATMTDPSQESGQALVNNIYNKQLYTIPADGTPVWTPTGDNTGEFAVYITAQGKNGKTYTSWAGLKQGVQLHTILDALNVNPNSLEIHVVYKNGDQQKNPQILTSIGSIAKESATYKRTLLYDDSRDAVIRSASGTQYQVSFTSNNWDGKYLTADKYKAQYGNFENVAGVYMNQSQIKPNDTVELIIPVKSIADASKASDVADWITVVNYLGKWPSYSTMVHTSYRRYEWDKLQKVELTPVFYYPATKQWYTDPSTIKDLDPYSVGKIADATPDSNPNSQEIQSIMHYSFVGLNFPQMIGYDVVENGKKNMALFGFKPLQTKFESKLPSLYTSYHTIVTTNTIEPRLTSMGWTVEFRGHNTQDSVPTHFYGYYTSASIQNPADIDSRTTEFHQVSVIPAMIRNAPQHYYTTNSSAAHDSEKMPSNWTADSLLLHVYHADEPLAASSSITNLEDAVWLQEYDKAAEVADGTIKVAYEYHAPGQTDENNVTVDKIDPNKAGVYKVTFTRTFGANTPISTYQYVYINEDATESKTVTRTIVEHTPTGVVETKQPATISATVTTDAETGKKTYSDWSTATWGAHTAKAVDGWTADKNADEVTVTGDTEDTRVDIYYSRPTSEEKTVTRTIFIHMPDGTVPEVKQTATLHREGTESTTDDGTTQTWGDWSEDTWDAFKAPTLVGWTADKNIDAQTVTVDTADAEEHIHYTKSGDNTTPETPTTPDNSNNTDGTSNAKPGTSNQAVKASTNTPKTSDAALAVAPVAATGLTALLGGLIARKRRKN